jgi:hypothetical protein
LRVQYDHTWGSLWTGGETHPIGPADDPTTRQVLQTKDGLLIDLELRAAVDVAPPEIISPVAGVRLIFDGSDNLDDLDLAEVFLGHTVQPATGIVRAWEDQVAPGVSRLTTRAGRTYAIQSADAPRRSFTVRHQSCAGADAELYDDLLREIGYGLRPFYFDPPATASQIYESFDSVDAWSVVGATKSQEAGFGFGTANGPYLSLQGLKANPTTGVTTFLGPTLAPPQDWRNMILTFDFRTDDDSIALDSDLRVVIHSAAGSGVEERSAFYFGAEHLEEADTNVWRRYQIDLDAVPDEIPTSLTLADLSAVDQLTFLTNTNSNPADRTYRFDNIYLIDKDAQPVYVELVDYEKRQSGRNPSLEISYDYRLELVEKLP